MKEIRPPQEVTPVIAEVPEAVLPPDYANLDLGCLTGAVKEDCPDITAPPERGNADHIGSLVFDDADWISGQLASPESLKVDEVIKGNQRQDGVELRWDLVGEHLSLHFRPPGMPKDETYDPDIGGEGITARTVEQLEFSLPGVTDALRTEQGKVVVLGNGLSTAVLDILDERGPENQPEKVVLLDAVHYPTLKQDLDTVSMQLDEKGAAQPDSLTSHRQHCDAILAAAEEGKVMLVSHIVGAGELPAEAHDAALVINTFGPPQHTIGSQLQALAPDGTMFVAGFHKPEEIEGVRATSIEVDEVTKGHIIRKLPEDVGVAAASERVRPEFQETTISPERAAMNDIARLAQVRGPYVRDDGLRYGDTRCSHWSEARALTARTQKLADLGVPGADELVAAGQDLAETFKGLREYQSAPPCDSACTDQVFSDLNTFANSTRNTLALQDAAVAFGKEHRPVELTPRQEAVAQLVDAISVDVYTTYSRVAGPPESALRETPGYCMPITYLTQQRLREIGIESRVLQHTKGLFAHYYLEVPCGDGEPLYVDGTWQQTVEGEQDRSILPRVLIVPASQADSVAQSLGARPDAAGIWSTGRPCSTERWAYAMPPLRAILKADGKLDAPAPMPLGVRAFLNAAA